MPAPIQTDLRLAPLVRGPALPALWGVSPAPPRSARHGATSWNATSLWVLTLRSTLARYYRKYHHATFPGAPRPPLQLISHLRPPAQPLRPPREARLFLKPLCPSRTPLGRVCRCLISLMKDVSLGGALCFPPLQARKLLARREGGRGAEGTGRQTTDKSLARSVASGSRCQWCAAYGAKTRPWEPGAHRRSGLR